MSTMNELKDLNPSLRGAINRRNYFRKNKAKYERKKDSMDQSLQDLKNSIKMTVAKLEQKIATVEAARDKNKANLEFIERELTEAEKLVEQELKKHGKKES